VSCTQKEARGCCGFSFWSRRCEKKVVDLYRKRMLGIGEGLQ
jgi:hypothetical protein